MGLQNNIINMEQNMENQLRSEIDTAINRMSRADTKKITTQLNQKTKEHQIKETEVKDIIRQLQENRKELKSNIIKEVNHRINQQEISPKMDITPQNTQKPRIVTDGGSKFRQLKEENKFDLVNVILIGLTAGSIIRQTYDAKYSTIPITLALLLCFIGIYKREELPQTYQRCRNKIANR